MAAKTKKTVGYVVLLLSKYDDAFPCGWDDECEGALCYSLDSLAVFQTRRAAMAAIRISQLNTRLRTAQGLVANTDWPGGPDGVKPAVRKLIGYETANRK